MLAKPLSLLLIFVLTMINFAILLLPVGLMAVPFMLVAESFIEHYWLNIICLLAFITSSIMLLYLFLDIIFGFTVRRLCKGTVPVANVSVISGFEDIEAAFIETKKRFDMPDVELYVDQRFDVVNAFAVGSFRLKRIVIGLGLVQSLYQQSRDHQDYIDSLKGVLGHEMSHLMNKDFLPGLLVAANDTANNHVSAVLRFFFMIFAHSFKLIPVVGITLSRVIISLHNMLHFIISFFFRYVILPVYKFIQKSVGRSIEYRCDRESALAFSGTRMVRTLEKLGAGSYFTIFSTHPSTKSRISHVQDVSPKGDIIHSGMMNQLANILSLFALLSLWAYLGVAADVPTLQKEYMRQVYNPVKAKVMQWGDKHYWQNLLRF